LVDALRLMALERGLKYLNDYIVDNKLFNVEYEEENLDKARRQYKIVTEVENNYEKLKGDRSGSKRRDREEPG
jgi:t-SNARE complex subunit (syntaxin)